MSGLSDTLIKSPRAAGAQHRGRPRQFDEDVVLEKLTALFWQHGYEATSMSDIEAACGLNKSSLYNAFGSKHQLFATVLNRYIDRRMDQLTAMSQAVEGGVEALHTFLDGINEYGRQGCLAVNTSAELGSADDEMVRFSQAYRDRMRSALLTMMTIATVKGALNNDLIEARADLLLTFLLGLSVAVRGGARDAEIQRLIDAAHATVESWRV